MFNKEVYENRRKALISKMCAAAAEGQRGLAIFIGNVDAPAQYKDNCYKFRQDSTWLYFWGLDNPGYAAIIDLDNGVEIIYADDIEIGDIIWMGPQPSVSSLAASVGVDRSAPSDAFGKAVSEAIAHGRRIHFVPASRYYNVLKLRELGLDDKKPSVDLIKAIISLRLIKEPCEIAQLDDACNLGYEMHTVARNNVRIGILEQEIVGKMDGMTLGKGWGVSFPTILSQHGETLHNHLHDKIVEPGKLMVIDAGCENNMHYPSDHTRTLPTSGKFTSKQRDIYQIVCDCNNYAFSQTRPGVAYRDVHIKTMRMMLERLSALDIVRGDIDSMVEIGIAGLFQPHGLGHAIGLDVHDMEDYGENFVGYDEDQTRSSQLGLGSLRMARRLVPGNVISDEPGIYFIPALIELWKKEGTDKGFVNYAKLEEYYDFGGIRLEDDVLVTSDGARRLGDQRLPIEPDEVEEAMKR